MIETVEHPIFSRADFETSKKLPGLSAVVRLKDEQEFAMACLESIVPFFDEIVVVYHNCTDRTPEIVAEFAARYRKQVRAFHYLPAIAPIGSRAHTNTPANTAGSFVYYSNFALSQARFQVRCMWDGDQIADPATFGAVVRKIRALRPGTLEWWLSPWRLGYWWYKGVNLWQDKGQIRVSARLPSIGRRHDHGFSPAAPQVRFKKYVRGEYLFTRLLVHRPIGFVFYHLRAMKKQRGNAKYALEKYPDSHYSHRVKDSWINPPLWTLDELHQHIPETAVLPDPARLGIHPRALG